MRTCNAIDLKQTNVPRLSSLQPGGTVNIDHQKGNHMFTHLEHNTTPDQTATEPRMSVIFERRNDSLTFHIARDPEFLQGITDGRQLLPPDWDLTGKHGLWEVEDLLQFVQHELSSENQTKENEVRDVFDVPPRTPIYHLGLVAGLLATFAEAAEEGRADQC